MFPRRFNDLASLSFSPSISISISPKKKKKNESKTFFSKEKSTVLKFLSKFLKSWRFQIKISSPCTDEPGTGVCQNYVLCLHTFVTHRLRARGPDLRMALTIQNSEPPDCRQLSPESAIVNCLLATIRGWKAGTTHRSHLGTKATLKPSASSQSLLLDHPSLWGSHLCVSSLELLTPCPPVPRGMMASSYRLPGT